MCSFTKVLLGLLCMTALISFCSSQNKYECTSKLGKLLPEGNFTKLNRHGKKQTLNGCKNGLVLNIEGPKQFRCSLTIEKKIQWLSFIDKKIDLQQVKCSRTVMCGPPPTASHSEKTPFGDRFALDGYDKYFTGDTIDYRCMEGYEFEVTYMEQNDTYDDYEYDPIQNEIISRTECGENGLWSETDISLCVEIQCDPLDLPQIRNGSFEMKNTSMLLYKDSVKLVCDHGYRSVSGWTTFICSSNSAFKMKEEDIKCRRIECPEINNPLNGRLIKKGHYVNETTEFSCDFTFTLTGSSTWTCLDTGKWDETCVTCDSSDNHCPAPCIPIDATVISTFARFAVGDEFLMECRDEQVQRGDVNRTCQEDGQWSGHPLYCTGHEEADILATGTALLSNLQRVYINRPKTEKEPSSAGRKLNVYRQGGNNVYIFLDVSPSILEIQFNKAKDFIKALVNNIGISDDKDGTRLVLCTFAGHVTKQIDHVMDGAENAFPNAEEANKEIDDKLKFNQETKNVGTNLRDAFDELRTLISTAQIPGRLSHRKNAKYIAFVITDGEMTMHGSPTIIATNLKARGTELFIIQVGNKSRREKMLQKMASEDMPGEKHYLIIDDNEKIWNILISQMVTDADNTFPCGKSKQDPQLEVTRPEEIAAVKGAWPWYSALLSGTGEFRCGGTLITEEWILTAAHCFELPIVTVKMGQYYLDSDDGIISRENKGQFLHPRYIPEAVFDYDIALIRLSKEVTRSVLVRPLCLLEDTNLDLFTIGQFGVVVGHGKPDNHAPPSNSLMQKAMTIQPNCTAAGFNPEIKFCAGNNVADGSIDSCLGDSGGAFASRGVLASDKDRFVQLGIVSHGAVKDGSCRLKDKFGVYTKLTPDLIRWAKSTIAKVDLCGKTDVGLTNLTSSPIVTNANDGAWPWYTYLHGERAGDSQTACGGSLINENWVLTAGHCLQREMTVAEFDITTRPRGRIKRAIVLKIIHPRFDTNVVPQHDYDIGLVKLEKPVKFDETVKPICLPSIDDDIADKFTDYDTYGIVVGFGRPADGEELSEILRQKEMRIKPNAQCPKMDFNQSRMFCAGDDNGDGGTIDACQGDSGGPYAVNTDFYGDSNRYVQLGIVSSGRGCGRKDTYGKYTKLTPELLDWVYNVTMMNN